MWVAKIVLETKMVSPGSSTPTLMSEYCPWQDTTTLGYEEYIAAVARRDAGVEIGRYWSDMRSYFGPFGRTRRARMFKAGKKMLVDTALQCQALGDESVQVETVSH
jgi:hypothetical protein